MRIRRALWRQSETKVVMEWGWAATWDTRMGNCMLLLGKCNRQLATPSCQEMKLLQGAGPAGIQPSSSWNALGCPHCTGMEGRSPWARHSFSCCAFCELLMNYLKKASIQRQNSEPCRRYTGGEGWSVPRAWHGEMGQPQPRSTSSFSPLLCHLSDLHQQVFEAWLQAEGDDEGDL